MAAYLVLALPAGAPPPVEGIAYDTINFLTTQATAEAAIQAAADVLKPDTGDKLWVMDIAALAQYVATRSYAAVVG